MTTGSIPSGSGQTASDPSGWSVDTLKDYIERLIHEHDRRFEQRFIAQEKAVQAALASASMAVDKALSSAEKANDKYEADVERWRQANNEWRAAMLDRETKFVTNDTYNAAHIGLVTKVDDLTHSQAKLVSFDTFTARIESLDSKIDDLTKSRDLNQGRQMAMTAMIGLAFAAITVALRFVGT